MAIAQSDIARVTAFDPIYMTDVVYDGPLFGIRAAIYPGHYPASAYTTDGVEVVGVVAIPFVMHYGSGVRFIPADQY